MKTTYNHQNNIHVISMDDIIFAGRNHAYGAFYLRKNHNKFLLRSFMITFALVATLYAISRIDKPKAAVIIPPKIEPRIIIDVFEVPNIKVPQQPLLSSPSPSMIEGLIPHPMVINESAGITSDISVVEGNVGDLGSFDGGTNTGSTPSIFQIGGGGGDGGVIPDDTTTYIVPPEESADFQRDFRQWVAEHVNYPEDMQRMEIGGKVFFQFTINKQGYPDDVKITRGVDPALDQEVIRVIMQSPKWIPAKQGGRPVKQRFNMLINFQINR